MKNYIKMFPNEQESILWPIKNGKVRVQKWNLNEIFEIIIIIIIWPLLYVR
jgi:hypothetical protein